MRPTPENPFKLKAVARKLDVDNRIPLRNYYGIADTLLKQASIYRGEKNVIDLYIILLRYSSLVSETIPFHQDYQVLLPKERTYHRKKLSVVLNELESLKPEFQRLVDEMNKAFAGAQHCQLDGRERTYGSDASSLELPSVNRKGSLSIDNKEAASEFIDVKKSVIWPPQLEKSFIDIMVEEVNKGNMSSEIFTGKRQKQIREEFLKRTNHDYSVKELKQKIHQLRTKHREFSTLLNESTEFGWDVETNTVTVDEESWQRYLRAHPNARCFREKGCENYNLLEVIFNRSPATGQLHHASTQEPPNTNEKRELEDEFLNAGVHIDATPETQDDSNVIGEGNSRGHNNPISTDCRARKESRMNQMNDAFTFWSEASKVRTKTSLAKAERYKKVPQNQKATSSIKDQYSVSNCIDCLEEIGGIDDDTYVKALEKFKDLYYREMFIKIPIGRKLAWLNRM